MVAERTMMRLRDLSLQRKLMGIIMLTTVLALVLAAVTFLVYDYLTFKNQLANVLGTLADTLSASATERLVVNDRDGVDKVLAALRDHHPHVLSAWVVDQEGRVFASFHRAAGPALPPPALVEAAAEDGHVFAGGRLFVARTLRFGEQPVQRAGTFYLLSDLQEIETRVHDYLKILAIVLAGVSLVALFFSSRLQRVVSAPILELASVVRRVSEAEDYGVRARPRGGDEVGRLVDGVNAMLDQIQSRDEELRVARDRAEEANRAKSFFLANMSHELRTPLTAIIGYSEMLEDDAEEMGVDDFLPDLRKIQGAGKHLLGLINSILDLSKIEAGKMDLLVEPFDVGELVREVADTVAPLVEKNGNDFIVDCPDDAGTVRTDVTKTRQVLLNLLSNAAKFTRQGEVRLSVSRSRDATLELRVADSGIGMSREQLGRLFQPFTQADPSTARDYGGTGLGLALSLRFVKMMGGRVEVDSELGVGTTFTVLLPADAAAGLEEAPPPAARRRAVVALALATVLLAAGARAQQAATPRRIGEVQLFGDEAFTIEAATRTELPLSQAPSSVTVITARQIRQSGARTIPELLRLVAGVNVRWNPMVQTIDLRSFGENPFTSRVLLLIDGVPYNSWNKGGFPQHPGFDFFGLQNVKRIEVVRGPGSALYGENAFWGVINIVSLSGEDLDGGAVELFGGDLESRSASAMWGKRFAHGSLLVSGKWLNGQLPMRFWAEDNDSQVTARDLFVKAKHRHLELSYYRYDDELDGFAEPIDDDDLPAGSIFRSIPELGQEVEIAALKYDRRLPGRGLTLGGDLSFARRRGVHCGACHAALQDPGFANTRADHGSQLIADFRVGFEPGRGHDLLLGIEARRIDAGDHQDELLGGDLAAEPPPLGDRHPEPILSNRKVALYVQDQISLLDDRLRFTLGLRFDGRSSLFDDELSPRAAVLYNASDRLVLRASWSQAFRFPNFSELYQSSWFFSVDAPQGVLPVFVFKPNPELGPESIDTIEVGGDYRLHRDLSLKAALFYSEIDDFIVMAFGDGTLRFENHPDTAAIHGGELELRWDSRRRFTGFANWSYQAAEGRGRGLDSSGKPLELVYAPRHKLNAGAYFGPFAGLRGAVELSWRDDRLAPSFWNVINNDVDRVARLSSYALVNARLSYELPLVLPNASRPLRFSVYGKNLLDERPRETFVGIDSSLVGRTFYGAFDLGF